MLSTRPADMKRACLAVTASFTTSAAASTYTSGPPRVPPPSPLSARPARTPSGSSTRPTMANGCAAASSPARSCARTAQIVIAIGVKG